MTQTIDAQGNLNWGPVLRAGLYDISFVDAASGQPQTRKVAANLFSSEESRIEPMQEIVLGVDAVSAAEVSNERRASVWPWFLGLALLILMLEWWVYQRRIV